LHDLLDVAGGHPLGIQGHDLFIETWHTPLVLGNQHRLERPVPIAGGVDGQSPEVSLHGLRRFAVATIPRALPWVGLGSPGGFPARRQLISRSLRNCGRRGRPATQISRIRPLRSSAVLAWLANSVANCSARL